MNRVRDSREEKKQFAPFDAMQNNRKHLKYFVYVFFFFFLVLFSFLTYLLALYLQIKSIRFVLFNANVLNPAHEFCHVSLLFCFVRVWIIRWVHSFTLSRSIHSQWISLALCFTFIFFLLLVFVAARLKQLFSPIFTLIFYFCTILTRLLDQIVCQLHLLLVTRTILQRVSAQE